LSFQIFYFHHPIQAMLTSPVVAVAPRLSSATSTELKLQKLDQPSALLSPCVSWRTYVYFICWCLITDHL